MKTLNAIAYFRDDIQEIHKEVPLNQIEYHMLTIANTGIVLGQDLSVFVDDDGSTRILKNRLGKTT